MRLEGKRTSENESERRAERKPLYAPQAHEYGAKAAYLIEEITGDRPWWSSLLFHWVTPLLELGKSRHLTAGDLFPLATVHQSAEIAAKLEAEWTIERSQKGRRASLLLTLLKPFGVRVILVGALKLLADTLAMCAPPLLIRAIIEFLGDTKASSLEGLFYSLIVLVLGAVQVIATRQCEYLGGELGLFVRSAVSTAVYKHILAVAPSILQRAAPGEVAGYVTVDAASLETGVLVVFSVMGGVVQVCLGGWLLWSYVGHTMWAGAIVLVLSVPCSLYLDMMMRQSKVPGMEAKDDRVQSTVELLEGIKTLKLLAWERIFTSRVNEARDTELQQQHKLLVVSGCKYIVGILVPVLVCSSILVAYAHFISAEINVATMIPALIVILLLVHGPLTRLPRQVLYLRDVRRSLLRVNSFLTEPTRLAQVPAANASPSVTVKNADFKWDTYQAKSELDLMLEAQGIFQSAPIGPALHHINFYAEAGEVHAIVGAADCGKSTLLAGIAGLVRCTAGDANVRGPIAYIDKEPFLLSATVRDNVCFGRPFNADRYFEAIRLSCLRSDLQTLPQGDRTLVGGDRGATLTLNQRVRVELARSFYRDADVYVVDDVLSAMDKQKARKIFKRLVRKARESSKIVLTTTSSLAFIKQCTSVVVLARGSIIEAGSFKSLVNNKKWGVLSEFVRADGKATMEEADFVAAVNETEDADVDSDDDQDVNQVALEEYAPVVADDSAKADASLEEDAGEENIRGAVALWMMRSIGGGAYFVFGFLVLLYLVSCVFTFLGLSWISKPGSSGDRLQGYIAFNVLYVMVTVTTTAMISYGGVRASRDVFQVLADRLARAPMAFHDATSSMRLASRLAKDLAVIDDTFAHTWPRLLTSGAHLLVITGVLLAVSPWLMFVLAPLILALFQLEECFGSSARDLKRIHFSTADPIQSCVDDTLRGVTAIRLHGADQLFLTMYHDRVNSQHQVSILRRSAACWLGIRVDAAVLALIISATLAAVHVHESSQPAASHVAGRVAVALMFVWSVSPILVLFLKSCDDVRASLVAGGRVKAYSKMPVEAALDSPLELRPRPDWPTTGAIQFENVSVRYRQGLPRVLRGVSVSIKGGDTVAVIGAPGSGKKTIFNALTRLVELTTGCITIDCVDISKLGLHDLRAKIAVLSPEAVLFTGSIRSNLDPAGRATDDRLWAVIKTVQLNGVVLSLDEIVHDKGQNYSANERQLLCLARAILRAPKLLLVDDRSQVEDVDVVDRCVRQAFPACTRLVVTERVSIAADCDRVLVMESGQVAEFGVPSELQKSNKTKYRAIVDEWKRRNKQLGRK